MKRLLILAALGLVAAGCARLSTSWQRRFEAKQRNYEVEQFSGGVKVREYRFRGILNDARDGGGYYWFVGDTLYEVSGDLAIRSWP